MAFIARIKILPCSLIILSQLLQTTSSLAAPPTISSASPVASLPTATISPNYVFQLIDAGDYSRLRQHLDFYIQTISSSTDNSYGNLKPNLEFADSAGNTPLIRAAAQPNLDILRYLVAQGANLTAENLKWETPLITAYNTGNFNNAKFLLSRGTPDPYNVAGRITTYEEQQIAEAKTTKAASNVSKNLTIIGGTAAVAGGVAAGIALAGGGSDTPTVTALDYPNSSTIDCGSGSGVHPEACTATDFVTTEATAQEGIVTMNAQYALAHGYDGSIYNRASNGTLLDETADGSVLVGVIDSGVDLDHPDLNSNIRTDLAVTCTSTGCVAGGDDFEGHGTNVAGIIAAERNDVGIHGIAPKAKLMPISTIGVTDGSISTALKYANDNAAQVVNNSYGLIYGSGDFESVPIIDATGPVIAGSHPSGTYTAYTPSNLRTLLTTTDGLSTLLTEFQQAATDGRIMVFSAGNSALDQVGVLAGLPLYFQGATAPAGITQPNYDIVNPAHYDWKDIWVASVSLKDDNTISSFSNECGVAKEWCLVAPGEIASSTEMGGTFSTAINGTSFSAPNVTGAIAVMLGAYPQLSPQRVLEILFDTATDLGTAGTDDIYGRGLVNLQKATDPTAGSWVLSVGHSSSSLSSSGGASSSFAFATSGFGLSAPFGNALANNNSSLIFLDGYGKDYTIPLSMVSTSLTPQKTAFEAFMGFADNEFDTVVNNGDTSFGFKQAAFTGDPNINQNIPFERASFQTSLPIDAAEKVTVAFNYKTDPAEALINANEKRVMMSDAYTDPYVGMIDHASSNVISYDAGQMSYKLAAYYGRASEEYGYHFDGSKPVSGIYSEARLNSPEMGADVTLNNGVSIEQNSLLGSETSGAFGIDKSTTYHAGIAGHFLAAKDVMLLANYRMGITQIEASNNSLFTNFGNIMTNSFAAGIEVGNVRSQGDRVGFSVSQPLRVISGKADLSLPYDVASNGEVLFQNDHLNLAPSGRQLDFESYYNLPIDTASSLNMNAIYRMNPNNGVSDKDDLTLLGKVNYGF